MVRRSVEYAEGKGEEALDWDDAAWHGMTRYHMVS